jgi:Fe-S cluster assembly protein SufB
MDYSFGLTREFVIELSNTKEEPKWMLEKRLQAFDLYINTALPSFGPSLDGLDLHNMKV